MATSPSALSPMLPCLPFPSELLIVHTHSPNTLCYTHKHAWFLGPSVEEFVSWLERLFNLGLPLNNWFLSESGCEAHSDRRALWPPSNLLFNLLYGQWSFKVREGDGQKKRKTWILAFSFQLVLSLTIHIDLTSLNRGKYTWNTGNYSWAAAYEYLRSKSELCWLKSLFICEVSS